jgi:protein TonB
MPRALFDQVLVPAPVRRPSRWIKVASLGVHVLVVLLVMVLPLTAAFDLPGIYTRLPTVMLASVPSMPPEPPPPVAAAPVTSVVQAVPLEAPDGVREEIPRPPAATSVGVPGSLPVVGVGSPVKGVAEGPSLTPQPPPPVQPRRVGGDIQPPERIIFKAPLYPPLAQAARIEGTVILEAVIDAQGVVQDVTVLRSVPLLDRAAIEAVRQWRYSPTKLNGVAIPVRMSITVTFSIRQPAHSAPSTEHQAPSTISEWA